MFYYYFLGESIQLNGSKAFLIIIPSFQLCKVRVCGVLRSHGIALGVGENFRRSGMQLEDFSNIMLEMVETFFCGMICGTQMVFYMRCMGIVLSMTLF
jgi:hypothetical protein